ncbi:unnamed protein product [Zymoseptoria tritici ST99CH_3D1]|nr:unnamed protein product [Zymoseptoria tritici ST99CH_3D1]
MHGEARQKIEEDAQSGKENQPQQDVPRHVQQELTNRGIEIGADGNVTWADGALAHPRNWKMPRKLYDTGVLTTFITISAMTGNVGTATARSAQEGLRISPVVANIAFASMFFFGQAAGGLLFPPYTESFGRKRTNVLAAVAYVVSCIVVGAPQSLPAIIIGRFFNGFLSALPTVVGSGALEDMWSIRPRVWAIDTWIKGSIIGIAVGPAFATYVSTSLGWPWVYHISAILLAGNSFLFLWTKESRPSVVLKREIVLVERTTGFRGLQQDKADHVPDLSTFARTMLCRPVRFFFTEPIICTVSTMSAVIFSSVYLQTEGLTVTYQVFGFSEREASLVYLTWIIGLILTIPLRLFDWHVLSARIRQRKAITPEDKITGFFVAAPVLCAALWWFAWTVPPYAPTISPFVSLAALILVGACLNEFDGILQGYLTDSYAMYAASANAPLAVIRGILSGAFPIFARQMFTNLGSNISTSILAIIATVFVGIAIWFWFYAAKIRESSSWAVSVNGKDDGEEERKNIPKPLQLA